MSAGGLEFIDLFSGLGGFHAALARLGHRCVFASEIDSELQNLYRTNFGMKPHADIRDSWEDVPEHDVLCAGFPCQSFSKAGNQLGFQCPDSGDLFGYILNIIDRRNPRYILFENVPNILRHRGGKTWDRIQGSLSMRGYSVVYRELSPHLFGIPQVRHRVIMIASLGDLKEFDWRGIDSDRRSRSLSELLDDRPADAAKLSQRYIQYLEVWDEFLHLIGEDAKMPSFPIWAMEFGADYPCERRSPAAYSQRYIARFSGAFGERLAGKTRGQQLATLPPYARGEADFPGWKVRFIHQNRKFYETHKSRLKSWVPKVGKFPSSFQKLEWNWQSGARGIWDKVIQFRASGIRVKNPSTAPSLVALTASQVPVIAWEGRYMTVRECARLQSLDHLPCLPAQRTRAFRALGNAVNADVVYLVAKELLGTAGAGDREIGEERMWTDSEAGARQEGKNP